MRKELTKGSVLVNLLRFSLPLIIMNLLQAFYNTADMAIAGHFVGSVGMTAINTSGQITNIILMLIIGFSNGVTIVTGQLLGAGKEKEIKGFLVNMMVLFGALAIGVTILCNVFAVPLLHLVNMPEASFADALSYLRICLAGTLFIYLYNTVAAMLKGVGDSVHPMMVMILSTAMNVVLDFLFMGPLDMGVKGAALATILSQIVSFFAIFFLAVLKTEFVSLQMKNIRIEREKVQMVFKVGLPQACQFSATQISFLIILAMVNSYGVIAAAAVGAVNRVATFAQLPGQALNVGVLTTTAQNLPLQNYKRILKSMLYAILIALGIAAVFCCISVVRPEVLLGIFTNEQEVITVGTLYLILVSVGTVIESLIYTMTGVVSGAGYTTITMVGALTAAFGRIIIALILQNVTSLGLYSIGVAAIISPVIPVLIMLITILSGKWKISRIQKELDYL